MPEFQVALQEVLSEKISSMGTRALMNFLIATGNKALVQAILAKSMTPQQALLLKKVIKDPQVAEAVGEVKDTLLEGVNQSIENVKESVLPKLEEAAGDIATGVGGSVITAASDLPPVGAVISLVTGIGTVVDAVDNATQIKDEFEAAIEPIQNATEEIGRVNNVVNDAVARAESQIPQAPVLPGVPGTQVGDKSKQVSTEAGDKSKQVGTQVGDKSKQVGTQVGTEVGDKSEQVSTEAGVEADAQSEKKVSTAVVQPKQLEKKSAPVSTTAAAAAGGGSRKRRHIHKLSRRIERTLRRVQKKYGLHDKNSFLRRTLHSRKK